MSPGGRARSVLRTYRSARKEAWLPEVPPRGAFEGREPQDKSITRVRGARGGVCGGPDAHLVETDSLSPLLTDGISSAVCQVRQRNAW